MRWLQSMWGEINMNIGNKHRGGGAVRHEQDQWGAGSGSDGSRCQMGDRYEQDGRRARWGQGWGPLSGTSSPFLVSHPLSHTPSPLSGTPSPYLVPIPTWYPILLSATPYQIGCTPTLTSHQCGILNSLIYGLKQAFLKESFPSIRLDFLTEFYDLAVLWSSKTFNQILHRLEALDHR